MPIEELASAFASRIRDLPGNQFHDLFDAAGYHLLRKHFYVPVPELASSDIQPSAWTTPSPLAAGLDMNENAAHELMDIIPPPFLAEFRARFPSRPARTKGFSLINCSYMAVDAHLLYGMVRDAKPQRIIEIGNGASTVIAVAAADLNRAEGHPVEVSSISHLISSPMADFANGYPGLSELIVKQVQDVPVSVVRRPRTQRYPLHRLQPRAAVGQ